jgi:phosphoserine phosphatase
MTIVAFDFDGTLSDSEMTVLLGQQNGVARQMEEITERAMNDELDYAESLRKRVALLEGLSESDVEAAFEQVTLRRDADTLLDALDAADTHTAILTGGFERGVEAALERADVSVDTIVANRLVSEGSSLTGAVEGPLIEGTKDDALDELVADVERSIDETIAIGDGANDLPMLEAADTAIGYLPKDAVRPHCDLVVAEMSRLQRVLREDGVLG